MYNKKNLNWKKEGLLLKASYALSPNMHITNSWKNMPTSTTNFSIFFQWFCFSLNHYSYFTLCHFLDDRSDGSVILKRFSLGCDIF